MSDIPVCIEFEGNEFGEWVDFECMYIKGIRKVSAQGAVSVSGHFQFIPLGCWTELRVSGAWYKSKLPPERDFTRNRVSTAEVVSFLQASRS